MQNVIKNLVKGDVSLLVLSGLAAQAVNLVAYPFLTQNYSPASFGAFSVVAAIASFSGAAIMLRFDVILQLVENHEEDDILTAALVTGIALALAGATLLFAFGSRLFNFVAAAKDWHNAYCLVIPVLAFLTGLASISREYYARKLRYLRISLANMARTLTMVSCQLGLVFLLPGPTGLITGFGLGLLCAVLIAWPLPRSVLFTAMTTPTVALEKTRAAFRWYKHFISVDVVNTLIAASVLTIYPIMVVIGFGATEAGYFAVASRLAFLPVDVLAGPVSTVFFQRFSLAARKKQNLTRIFLITLAFATACALTISIVVYFVADFAVRIIFSEEWTSVSHIMIQLIPTFACRFVVGCISSTPLALSQPKILFMWNLVQIAVVAASWALTAGKSLDRFLLLSGYGLLATAMVYLAALLRYIRQNKG